MKQRFYMNRTLKHICAAAVAVMACSCGPNEGREGREQKALGPEETVLTFCRAVSCGDFDKAREFCDTVSMDTYLRMNMAGREKIEQTDSTVAKIATALLSEAEIEIGNTVKDGDSRVVSYSISSTTGITKNKTATVKKDKGVWKVEKITDAN